MTDWKHVSKPLQSSHMRRRLTAVLGLVGFLGKGVAIYMILTEMMVVTTGSLIRNILRWECLDFNANL